LKKEAEIIIDNKSVSSIDTNRGSGQALLIEVEQTEESSQFDESEL
jgi:hypothetical protein